MSQIGKEYVFGHFCTKSKLHFDGIMVLRLRIRYARQGWFLEGHNYRYLLKKILGCHGDELDIILVNLSESTLTNHCCALSRGKSLASFLFSVIVTAVAARHCGAETCFKSILLLVGET